MSGRTGGFLQRSLGRLGARRGARAALVLIGLLLGLAALAPLIANAAPLAARVGGAWQWPAIRGMTAADRLWLGGVLAGAAGLLLRRRLRLAVGAAGLLLAAAGVAAAATEPVNLAAWDWRALERAPGNRMVWAPIAFGAHTIDKERVLAAPDFGDGHPLGTDPLGRDVAARLLFGARTSLLVGVLAAATATVIGLLLGAVAGWWRGGVDAVVSWVIQVFMCFPVLVLVLALCAFIEPDMLWIMLLIGLVSWPGPARLVRGEVMRLRDLPFVEAARALGVGEGRLLFRHVLPNALGPLVVWAALGTGGAILLESTLSFLGIGPAGTPSWGGVLRDGRGALPGGAHVVLFPGLLIFLTVLAWNVVAEALRDATDPWLAEELR